MRGQLSLTTIAMAVIVLVVVVILVTLTTNIVPPTVGGLFDFSKKQACV